MQFSKVNYEEDVAPASSDVQEDAQSEAFDSKETSAETVIPTGIDPKYLQPTPCPKYVPTADQPCLTAFYDSTFLEDVEPPSGIFLLEMTNLEMTKIDETKVFEFQTLAAEQNDIDFEPENIDLDEEEKSFKNPLENGSYVDFGEGIKLDMIEMAKEQAVDLWAQEQFSFQCSQNNPKDLFEQAEKSNEEKNKFDLDYEPAAVNIQPEKSGFLDPIETSLILQEVEKVNEQKDRFEEKQNYSSATEEDENKTLTPDSISDYFQHKTSNIGHSLGSSSGEKLRDIRPNFGLQIENSPKPKPVAMITSADVIKEAVTLSESKNHNLTASDLAKIHSIAKMILISSPGHDVQFYAQHVLKNHLLRQKQELQSQKLANVTQFLPSILEDSATGETNIKHQKNVKFQKHSSPKKMDTKREESKRVPMEDITKATLALESLSVQDTPKRDSVEHSCSNLSLKFANLTQQSEKSTIPCDEIPVKLSKEMSQDQKSVQSKPISKAFTKFSTENEENMPPKHIPPKIQTSKIPILQSSQLKNPLKKAGISKEVGHFPIVSNRLQISWFSFDRKSDEQFLTLRNDWSEKTVRVSLFIKEETKSFTFSQISACDSEDSDHWKNGQALDISIGPKCTRDIFIGFRNNSPGLAHFKGDLIIKPHGLTKNEANRALKSKVHLQAFTFESFRLSIFINEEPLKDTFKYDENEIRIKVKNVGHSDAYFTLESHKIQFVLSQHEERRFKLNLNEVSNQMIFVYGPEITRKIVQSCHEKYLKSDEKSFQSSFDNEKPTNISYRFDKHDLKYFHKNFKSETINIEIIKDVSFFNLPMIDDSKLSTVSSIAPKKSKPKVWLDNSNVYFPTVTQKNGTSLAKVTIKNKTNEPISFQIQPLEAPFENHHSEVTVKPRFYLSIPILFRPTHDNQKSSTVLVFKSNGVLLKANLIAASHYIIN